MGLRQSLERLDGWERSRSAVIVGDYSVCASCSATLVKIGGLPISPRRRFRQVGGVAAGLPFGAGATRLAAHHGQAVAVAVAFQVIAVAVAGQSAVPCGGRGGLGTAAAADEFRRSRCVQSPATGPFSGRRKWPPGRKDTARRQGPRDGSNACRRRWAVGNIGCTWSDPVPRVFSGSGNSGRLPFVPSCACRPGGGSGGRLTRRAGGPLVVMAFRVSDGCGVVRVFARRSRRVRRRSSARAERSVRADRRVRGKTV